jgi:rhodanese-related sulfurtransferase
VTRPPVPEVDPLAAAALVADGAVLLDVREPEEWDAGHAPGAVHVPLGQLPHRIPEHGPRIVVVCRSGRRSEEAARALIAWGYDALNLAGGMQAWAAAGLPVRDPAGRPGRVA